MPQESKDLSSFQRRDTKDKMMFGFVKALSMFPGISVNKSLILFAATFKIHDFNLESERVRYQRIESDFWDDQKSKPEIPL